MAEAHFVASSAWRVAPGAAVLAPRPRLPIPLTSFVGRDGDVEAVRSLLEQGAVVTLVGPGGAGKTRLALAVAVRAEHDDRNPDGVWFADLASIADPALVAPTVAQLFGARESATNPVDDLAEHLHDRRLLLVLDNCEHVIDASAAVAERLAQDCPGVRILATSRERLDIPGEAAFAVGSLPSDAAVRLFLDRAHQVAPDLVVAAEDERRLVELCGRLDGMPLALELAAARLSVLSLAEIVDGLDDHFRLLGRGWRTASPRQRTLRATVDWSYDLLDEAERALLRRASVFAGPFTVDAARGVCAGSPVDAADVLDGVDRLSAKSLLVVVSDRCTAPKRYRLLETIRQYGREKLDAAAETSAVRDRHLRWFAEQADALEAKAFGADGPDALDLLECEDDNYRAALEWSVSGGDRDLGLALAHDAFVLWSWRGYAREGLAWMERVLDADGPASAVAAAVARRAAILAYSVGEVDRAVALCSRAVDLARPTDEAELARALSLFGGIWMNRGDMAAAKPLLDEGLAVARRMGNAIWSADCLTHLGWWAERQGRYHEACAFADELDAIDGDNRFNRMRALEIRAYCRFKQAHYEEATTAFQEIVDIGAAVRDPEMQAAAFEGLGAVAAARGRLDEARAAYDRAVAFTHEQPDLMLLVAWAGLGELAAAEGRYDEARILLDRGVELARKQDDSFMLAWALNRSGDVEVRRGDVDAARAAYEEAKAIGTRCGMPWVTAAAVDGLAALATEAATVRLPRLRPC